MSKLHRFFLLIALLAIIGCASKPPLPAGGPPQDFLFVYTQELPDRESATDRGSPPGKIRIALDGGGTMEVEATYLVPHRTVEKTTIALRNEQFQTIYDAILEADFFTLQDEWEGTDRDIGRETWFVLGNGKSRSISVVDARVLDLDRLRSTVTAYLPAQAGQAGEKRETVIMDTRTRVFHAADDPHVSEIPRKVRRIYADPWAALNDGGQPCPLFPAKR